MSDVTDTTAVTTTAQSNDAIPISVTATPVDTNTIATDAAAITSPTASSIAALTSPSTSSTTFVTSSIRTSSSISVVNPFTEIPPFLTATGVRPPFATGSTSPFFFGDTSNGLSTGAKAGIGVGVAALALSVVAVALLILRMRKKENEWTTSNAPPPPYTETGSSNTEVVEMRPKPAQKHIPPPLVLNIGGGSNHSSAIAPVASRTIHRKSKASVRPRRNSNLAPVSEEEPESSGPNLALVSEGDDGASMTAPPTPRTPRTVALHALTGESGAPSPMGSSFRLEPVPPLPGGNVSPISSEFDTKLGRSGKGGR